MANKWSKYEERSRQQDVACYASQIA